MIFLYATRGVAILFVEVEFFRRPDRRLSSDSGEAGNFPQRDNPTRTDGRTKRTCGGLSSIKPFPFFSIIKVGGFLNE